IPPSFTLPRGACCASRRGTPRPWDPYRNGSDAVILGDRTAAAHVRRRRCAGKSRPVAPGIGPAPVGAPEGRADVDVAGDQRVTAGGSALHTVAGATASGGAGDLKNSRPRG